MNDNQRPSVFIQASVDRLLSLTTSGRQEGVSFITGFFIPYLTLSALKLIERSRQSVTTTDTVGTNSWITKGLSLIHSLAPPYGSLLNAIVSVAQ
jgi:hypothetical protein